jgi:hypothetical protein
MYENMGMVVDFLKSTFVWDILSGSMGWELVTLLSLTIVLWVAGWWMFVRRVASELDPIALQLATACAAVVLMYPLAGLTIRIVTSETLPVLIFLGGGLSFAISYACHILFWHRRTGVWRLRKKIA